MPGQPIGDVIDVVDEQAKAEVMGLLERLMERARAGEIKGLVVLVEAKDRMGACWTEERSVTERIGGIEALKHTWLANLLASNK